MDSENEISLNFDEDEVLDQQKDESSLEIESVVLNKRELKRE